MCCACTRPGTEIVVFDILFLNTKQPIVEVFKYICSNEAIINFNIQILFAYIYIENI